MRNKISRYEENQVDRFLYDLYLLWGGNLDEDMCIGEGWIVYLEGREKYQWVYRRIIIKWAAASVQRNSSDDHSRAEKRNS